MRRSLGAIALAMALAAPAAVDAKPPPCKDHTPCPPQVVLMGRLTTSGYEAGFITLDGAAVANAGTGAASYATSSPRSGARNRSYASGSSGSSNDAFTFGTAALNRFYYARAYIRFPSSVPSLGSSMIVMQLRTSSTAAVSVRLKNGTLGFELWNNGTSTQIGSGSGTVVAGTWYRVEVALKVNSGASDDSAELRVDGASIASTTTDSIGTTADSTAQLNVGIATASIVNVTVEADDIAVNDDQGADQNTWPGDGKVVNLVPTSDNARATLWTGGAGGTTNLWDAVNNIPPVGVASASATNTSQIEHAGGASGTTDAYDANMTTYAAAGLAAGDVVNLVTFSEVDGEDIATGTKLLNFEVLSNPAVTSPGDVTAGNNVGAVGSFSTNWSQRVNQGITYNPSVTLGTAPVMRVRRPETASRVASVCYMAMIVDYTPANAAVPEGRAVYPAFLAQ